ncbi:MAG TPA: HAMP domain-containing sensor histidine kinase [Actinomycetes bacterium]|nr:HAMP domain-containing sensor histidine kinase [Actinomycetes bacterium]
MSLRTRLPLAFLALLTLCLSGFGFGVYAVVDAKLHDEFEATVRARGDQLAPLLTTVVRDLEEVKPAMQQLRPPADTFTVVEETWPQQGILYKTDSLVSTSLPDVPPGRVVDLRTPQGPLSLYAVDFEVPDLVRLRALKEAGEPAGRADRRPKPLFTGRITVARSLSDVDSSLRLLRNILIGGGLAAVALATLIGIGLSDALLRPLERMRQAAQRIGDERDFHLRLPVDRPRGELGRLSLTVNQTLDELEQAHASLQATLDAQRRFVGDASHELRTPVTAIRTNVEFLRRAPHARQADRDEALADALAEVHRMEQLVGDLLALARLEAASEPVHRPLRLDALLADLHRDAARLAEPEIEVVLRPMPELWVRGDLEDLRRASWNLIENAVKYTRRRQQQEGPDGQEGQDGPGRRPGRRQRERVSLTLVGRDHTAVLTVADTGIGIAREDQRFVFDRFWRAPQARATPGSGLGLAITRRVAQAHGGSVRVRSSPGQGSTFTLELPAIDPPGEAEDRLASSAFVRTGMGPHS